MMLVPIQDATSLEYRVPAVEFCSGASTSLGQIIQRPMTYMRWTPRGDSLIDAPLEPWKRHAIEQIVAISNLPVGWNGHASPPPTQAVRDCAINLVSTVYHSSLKPPKFAPLSGGGLQIDWWSGFHREIEIHIESTLDMSYLKVESGTPINEGTIGANGEPTIRELIDWLRLG